GGGAEPISKPGSDDGVKGRQGVLSTHRRGHSSVAVRAASQSLLGETNDAIDAMGERLPFP
ncbi:MAG: hypothetical protein K8J08_19270, partial [Thermoanaerobaculia bacterium]|nr:hypothetical protein [Thermoanaerobaculia bacterium]